MRGKGKQPQQWDTDDDDDDDEAYVTSNDFNTPNKNHTMNGSANGKGKAVDNSGFRDAAHGDDEDLYGL